MSLCPTDNSISSRAKRSDGRERERQAPTPSSREKRIEAGAAPAWCAYDAGQVIFYNTEDTILERTLTNTSGESLHIQTTITGYVEIYAENISTGWVASYELAIFVNDVEARRWKHNAGVPYSYATPTIDTQRIPFMLCWTATDVLDGNTVKITLKGKDLSYVIEPCADLGPIVNTVKNVSMLLVGAFPLDGSL